MKRSAKQARRARKKERAKTIPFAQAWANIVVCDDCGWQGYNTRITPEEEEDGVHNATCPDCESDYCTYLFPAIPWPS